jgi:hypothetical protein
VEEEREHGGKAAVQMNVGKGGDSRPGEENRMGREEGFLWEKILGN